MDIDKMIDQWEGEHSSLLNEYSKGNANNELMQMYRSQMKNVLAFIEQLKQIKNNFVLADVSRSPSLTYFAENFLRIKDKDGKEHKLNDASMEMLKMIYEAQKMGGQLQRIWMRGRYKWVLIKD